MDKKPALLVEYYRQNSQQFGYKVIYSRVGIIVTIVIMMFAYFINMPISIMAVILFFYLLSLLITQKRYFYNLNNKNKIKIALDAKFPNCTKSKDKIVTCFLNQRFVELFQLLNQPIDQNYFKHDAPIYLDDFTSLNDNESSYFDSIYIEINIEQNGQQFYCLLRQEKKYCNDEEYMIGLTNVMTVKDVHYHTLQQLIYSDKTKLATQTSIIS